MLLLDTCTFIWLASDPSRLSAEAVTALDSEIDICLSDTSVWEICLKWQAKKIELPSPPRIWVSEQAKAWHLRRLPIEQEHLFRSVELSDLHKDPFDRILIAQARAEGLLLLTVDKAVAKYGDGVREV